MSFQQALSGLNAAAKNLDVIGNNVANTATVGFKAGQAQFTDVYAAALSGGGGSQVGIGTKLASVAQQFTQGNVTATNNPLDVAINGNGFFQIDTNGVLGYTRNGQFQIDRDEYLVTSDGGKVQGYPITNNVTGGTPGDIQLSTTILAPSATTSTSISLNLDSRASSLSSAAFNYADATTYSSSTSLTLYDSLGNSHVYSMYFLKTGSNAWNSYATLTNSAGSTINLASAGPLGTISFTSAGAISSGASTSQTINTAQLGTGAAALTTAVSFTGSTQFGSSFGVNSLNQDGYAPGRLTGYSISSDGTVKARYSNGQAVNTAKLVLGAFANPQGLQPLGNNLFAETNDSNQVTLGAPGSGKLGVLQASAVEESNVDLTAELVSMITAQRNYQANSQTIKTQDQILQTLVNLR
ncbi:MAG: flagellar hook protein FlgE [Pseudomonadota bacterium]